MSGFSANLALAVDSLRAHKLRAALTVLGLTMGVATLITVMTLVQGANLYVEQKIANLGINVFRIGRLPFALTDFSVLAKAQRNRFLYQDDMAALIETCRHCETVGASVSSTVSLRYKDRQMDDATLYGYSPSMAVIDTRNVELGRYFTELEDRHAASVCLIGDKVAQDLFPDSEPMGHVMRAGADEFTVIGTFERIGSVLGQDQDNFVACPAAHLSQIARPAQQPDSLGARPPRRPAPSTWRRTKRAAFCARAATCAAARTTISSSPPRTATSRSGRASARRFSRCS